MVREAARSLFHIETSQSLIDTTVDNRLYNVRRYWQDNVREMSSIASAATGTVHSSPPVLHHGTASQPPSQPSVEAKTSRKVMDIASIID